MMGILHPKTRRHAVVPSTMLAFLGRIVLFLLNRTTTEADFFLPQVLDVRDFHTELCKFSCPQIKALKRCLEVVV